MAAGIGRLAARVMKLATTVIGCMTGAAVDGMVLAMPLTARLALFRARGRAGVLAVAMPLVMLTLAVLAPVSLAVMACGSVCAMSARRGVPVGVAPVRLAPAAVAAGVVRPWRMQAGFGTHRVAMLMLVPIA
jgi:hypothetical protein